MASKDKELATREATRYSTIPTEQIVESVVDELEAMLVEVTKQAREYNIKVYWNTGEMLREAEKDNKINITSLVERVSHDNRISGRQMGLRNLWLAIKIFDSYPVFEKVYQTEFGENISISKIKKELTIPKPKKEATIDEMAQKLFNHLGVDKIEKLIKALQKLID